eukprot:10800775-Alexandrium_andersonii.AAC.1
MTASRSSSSRPSSDGSEPMASGVGPPGPTGGTPEQRWICPAAWSSMRTSSAECSSAGSPLPLFDLPEGA